MPVRQLAASAALTAGLAIALAGCSVLVKTAVDLVYDHADLPDENTVRDLPYRSDGDPKHRFNLFLPLADSARSGAPTVVFVHGGGWTEGDKDLVYGGEDVYNNIGRFFAGRGIGAATVSYRLMPGVSWREQVADVAAAVAAIQDTVAARGGDADALVLMGHSAGAHLSARVAVDAEARAAAGAGPVCGAMPVSGAALDLRDRETYALRDNFDYYSARFSDDGVARATPPPTPLAWQTEASVVPFVDASAPPFLILYAGGETEALQRQSRLLASALRAADVPTEVVVVPGRSHERIVPTLSRDDQTAGPAMLRFVRQLDCGGGGARASSWRGPASPTDRATTTGRRWSRTTAAG